MRKYLTIVLASLLSIAGLSARETFNLNRNWKFFTYNESASTTVNLPHTWNNDALSGRADYFRGVGNYLRYIDVGTDMEGKRIFIRFDGSNRITELLVNGRYVGQHRGGSNGFVFEITDFLNYGQQNLLWVIVNNSQTTDIMPTSGAENDYGGLFRDVELVVTGAALVSPDDNGADGVAIRTAKLSAEKAEGSVDVKVLSNEGRNFAVVLSVYDRLGTLVFENSARVKGENGTYASTIPFEIISPKMWNGPSSPYLYDFNVRILSEGITVDSLNVKSGFRSVGVSGGRFMLNGKPFAVHGAVLHRDRSMVGTAVNETQIEEDIDIMLEMGVTMVRVAGGSHSREFYDMCDARGLLVVSDLPFTGATTLNNKGFFNTSRFRENGTMQLRETICQLFNHPSIVAWNLFSEIEMRGENPVDYVRELNAEAKSLDSSRLTSGWSNQDGEINTVTDLVAWNHIFGWIEGLPDDIEIWREQYADNPAWNVLNAAVGYKCGGSVMQQSENIERPVPVSNWHPERWQTLFHETYLTALASDTLFWGIFPDCMFDFGAANYAYGDGLGISDLGLVTFDRKIRKDAFYLYKANWNSSEPFVYLTEKRWNRRQSQRQTVKVYSNLTEVELFVNGTSLGKVTGRNGIFEWVDVGLSLGKNTLTARAGDVSDSAVINIAHIF